MSVGQTRDSGEKGDFNLDLNDVLRKSFRGEAYFNTQVPIHTGQILYDLLLRTYLMQQMFLSPTPLFVSTF